MAQDEAQKGADLRGAEGMESEANQAVEGASCGAGNGQVDTEKVALQQELSETKDRYLRLMAEFENFKRRTLKEQSELLKYQGERLVVDLLEVVDNLELALSHASADPEKLKTGLEMTHKIFLERLGKWEIRGESGVGSTFDPQKHAAISRVPGSDAKPGTIIGELKKAYFYKDKLIRPGEVVVASSADAA
jgi:molecular chaperone GrpE